MYTVRSIADGASFELKGAPPIGATYRRLFESGATRAEWCFVLQRDGVDIGRVGVRVEATCPAMYLGALPACEAFVVGLWLPWDEPDFREAGCLLLARAQEVARREAFEGLQAVVHRCEAHAEQRRRVFEAFGMQLFQEKQGYGWRVGDPLQTDHPRLGFRELTATGIDRFRDVLGRAGTDTLDRNDRWYRERAGERNWASVFMTLHDESAPGAWLLATDSAGRDVGVVAVSRLEHETSTITFVGVVPEQRGKGYIDELLRAANEAALGAGFKAMLSDADVLNAPMTAAFVRNGHRERVCPDWHKRHFRATDLR